jgi:hypothetical protein
MSEIDVKKEAKRVVDGNEIYGNEMNVKEISGDEVRGMR